MLRAFYLHGLESHVSSYKHSAGGGGGGITHSVGSTIKWVMHSGSPIPSQLWGEKGVVALSVISVAPFLNSKVKIDPASNFVNDV